MGVVSQTAVTTFNQLSRPLLTPSGIVPTELFPLRNEVGAANKKMLDALKTKLHVYESRDTGAANGERLEAILQNMVAQSTLEIKVGAQVMLIKNVDEDLVNGSIGKVLGFYTAAEVCGSGGKVTLKRGIGLIRNALLKEDRAKTEEFEVAQRGNEGTDIERNLESDLQGSGERFPLVEFCVSMRRESILVGRSEFKVEDNETVAARRIQVGALIADMP